MTGNEVAALLGVSRRSVVRYRALPDWPAHESRVSVVAWATKRGRWDLATETFLGLGLRRNVDTCGKGVHPWVPENIYTDPSGSNCCRRCVQAARGIARPRG